MSLTAWSLFLGSTVSVLLRNAANASRKSVPLKPRTIYEALRVLENRIQRDEGKRGIKDILMDEGEMFRAAVEIYRAKRVVILTGFPCLLDFPVHTETDGPPGAVSIAKALLTLNKKVTLLTDECNEEVLLSCTSAMDLPGHLRSNLDLQSFPPTEQCDEKDLTRLAEIYEETDLVIGIERAGSNAEGKYLTMRGRDMTHLIAPLDLILRQQDIPVRSIGIGDGGNELGMGKALDKIIRSSIPDGEKIACVVPADHLIVASVSNWGGYALSAAAALVDSTFRAHGVDGAHVTMEEAVAKFGSLVIPVESAERSLHDALPSAKEETLKFQRMIDAGARDGITRASELMVDGMKLQVSLDVIEDIRQVLH